MLRHHGEQPFALTGDEDLKSPPQHLAQRIEVQAIARNRALAAIPVTTVLAEQRRPQQHRAARAATRVRLAADRLLVIHALGISGRNDRCASRLLKKSLKLLD
jgi:hypothetical protein